MSCKRCCACATYHLRIQLLELYVLTEVEVAHGEVVLAARIVQIALELCGLRESSVLSVLAWYGRSKGCVVST